MLLGGSGVGKTCLGAMEGLCELFIPGRKIAIIGSVYKHVLLEAELIYKGFLTLFPPSAATVRRFRDQKNYTEFQIDTIWGSSIRGYSLDYNEGAQVLGEGYDLVICAEADLIPNYILNRRVKRALDRRAQKTHGGYQHKTGRIVMYTTPHFGEGAASEEYNRIMEQTGDQPENLHIGKTVWPSTAYIRTAGVLENPAYDQDIYEARKEELLKTDPDAFYEQYHGHIRRRTGVVLDTFDRTKHIRTMPSPEELRQMRFGVGIDTGNHFAAVLCGIDRNRKKFILGEVASEFQTIYYDADLVKDMVVHVIAPVLKYRPTGNLEMDFNRCKQAVDAFFADYRSQHKTELDDCLGVPIEYQDMPQGGSIDQIREMFSRDELYVIDECEAWIKDANRYIWKNQKNGLTDKLEPRKKYDHLMDATRFIIVGFLEQAGPTEEAVAPVSFDEAAHRQMRADLFKTDTGPEWEDILNG